MPDNTKINQSLVIGVLQIAEVNLTRFSVTFRVAGL